MTTVQPAVAVRNLHKRYADIIALDGVTLEVPPGQIFGILGPNGAGKTTLVEILEGLRQPDAGEVTVCGLDPRVEDHRLQEIMGVQLQRTAFYGKLTLTEVLEEFARFYPRRADIPALLETFGLGEKRQARIETLSDGQKQRLAVALALVNEPTILFLDEPTAGLDAQTRREVWGIMQAKKGEGRTVILTTHYIEEAERLCDRVAILEAGKVLALDTPGALIAKSGDHPRVRLSTERPLDLVAFKELPFILGIETIAEREYVVKVQGDAIGLAITELIRTLEGTANHFADFSVSRPTLEEVFIELTGRSIQA